MKRVVDTSEIDRLRAVAKRELAAWTSVDEGTAYDAAVQYLAALCERKSFIALTREEFVHRVLACAGMTYDMDSLLFHVEAEVRMHFCEMWTSCDDGCYLRRNPDQRPAWDDGWVTISKMAKIDRERFPVIAIKNRSEPVSDAPTQPKRASRVWKSARNLVSSKVRNHVFLRDGHSCVLCKTSYKDADLHVDHIIPVSRGGSSDLSNLQTLCATCNQAKGDSRPEKEGAA